VTELLLLSGGIDSTALAAWRKPAATLAIDYGQRPAHGEIVAAGQVAKELGLDFFVLRVDCSEVGSGIMAGTISVNNAPSSEWWPFRNQLLVTLAAGWALPRGFDTIALGSVRTDGFHIDGTSRFFEAIDRVLVLQEGGMRVVAPALDMTSAELVERSGVSDQVLAWTISCHRGSSACGDCAGCQKHENVLRQAGRFQ
jgi:7-cyano-7-deazaguanine synthase